VAESPLPTVTNTSVEMADAISEIVVLSPFSRISGTAEDPPSNGIAPEPEPAVGTTAVTPDVSMYRVFAAVAFKMRIVVGLAGTVSVEAVVPTVIRYVPSGNGVKAAITYLLFVFSLYIILFGLCQGYCDYS
jgi:hypothetical protein